MDFKAQLIASQQQRLADLGYYRLKVDGVVGAGTKNAMARFKGSNGLRPRPMPGPLTMQRLWDGSATPWKPQEAVKGDPAWLTEAKALLGVREAPGGANNAQIMGWARDLDQWYPGDDTAWCGLFVAHCMAVGAPDEPQGFNRLGARAWLEYGKDHGEKLGSVCVLWRTSRAHWHGHVGLITGQNSTHVRLLGGNQGDRVSEDWFSRSRVLGFRGPVDWNDPVDVPFAATGRLSQTEA